MRKLTPEQKVAAAAYQVTYRLRNLETLRSKKQAYYASHREHFKQKMAEYRERNRDYLNSYDKKRRAENGEQKRAFDKAYYSRTKEVQKTKRADYWKANAGRKRDYDIAYRAAHQEDLKRRRLNYYEKNKAAFVARTVKRNAQQHKAMPKWANEFFIEEAYDLAARRTALRCGGHKWNVDHIVPLTSKIVCGLHTHTNLRVITFLENMKKKNRYWPDMPC